MNLGEKIKFIRESVGYSQEEFGLEIHRTQTTISAYEGGRKSPSYSILKEIDDFAKRHKIKINLL